MIQGGDPSNMAANPAYKLFSDAQYELMQAQRGSLRDPSVMYLPCKATPVDWYSEAAAQYWPTLSISSTQVRPANPTSPFMLRGGKQLIDKGLLQTIPPHRDAPTIKQQLQSQLKARISHPAPLRTTLPMLSMRPLEIVRARTLASPPVGRSTSRPLSIHDNEVARRRVTLAADPAFKKTLRPSPLASRVASLDRLSIDAGKLDLLPNKAVALKDKLLLRDLLSEQLTPVPISNATDGFSISFKYCMVNLTRSWLKLALLNTKNWYLYGTQSGDYSQGRLDNNPGMFPMLPTAFIAIRDLVIKANWSQTDLQAVKQAKFLGPFDIGNGTINQNTITAKGLQIVAWQSRLTPILPPLSSPSS